MNEEDRETVHDALIEATDLLYVLKIALDNNDQPTKDTKSYAHLVKLIQCKLANVTEIIQP